MGSFPRLTPAHFASPGLCFAKPLSGLAKRRKQPERYIREAKEFIASSGFHLPPFAFWSPGEWETRGSEYREIRDNQLGWDLTDFGGGDYEKTGLFLFTLRNGGCRSPANKKTYAEKIMVCRPGQVTPYHYHQSKMEDIINRGGNGRLCVTLYGSKGPHELDTHSPVPAAVDGRNFSVPAGETLRLSPGESVTLFQGVFHQFWAEGATLLIGEVSMVNDDHRDNFFLSAPGRFPRIVEDEEPLHLLVGDYGNLA
ncbi:MAG: D-lyxose/D-mannose family sugar isomerase [Treponema sp.]|nr:D-lyxose/D-mannose family sugar isomerase [Treponema sp.]